MKHSPVPKNCIHPTEPRVPSGVCPAAQFDRKCSHWVYPSHTSQTTSSLGLFGSGEKYPRSLWACMAGNTECILFTTQPQTFLTVPIHPEVFFSFLTLPWQMIKASKTTSAEHYIHIKSVLLGFSRGSELPGPHYRVRQGLSRAVIAANWTKPTLSMEAEPAPGNGQKELGGKK